MNGLPFVKGHGTENDFVLLPDREGTVEFTDNQVRAMCDRRAGLGADGVIVVRPAAGGGWFMDYRNADGSIAEMCGNGARVFARYLVDLGWEPPGTFEFQTRGGRRRAELGRDGDVSISMGPASLGGDSKVELTGRVYAGTAVDVGNPHLVCLLEEDVDLAALDLQAAPRFDPVVFPAGVNVEFVRPVTADRVRMRVFERGVGETRSCGTGTVAVAAAYRRTTGGIAPVQVDVPGGSVRVSFVDGEAVLAGPAVLVATGRIEPDFLAAHR